VLSLDEGLDGGADIAVAVSSLTSRVAALEAENKALREKAAAQAVG